MLTRTLAAATTLAAALIVLCPPAWAVNESGFSLEVLVDGRPLGELYGRGTTYVEALEGAEYALRLTNHTGRRIAVALAVDGLNSIDARTSTAAAASKWVLDPYETITVDGWQTSSATARKFFFTTEARSYGAWLGRTANLGVIEAVVYRERAPRPAPVPQPITGRRDRPLDQSPAPSARSQGAAERREKEAAGEALSDEMAATGIGRELDNPVRRVSFRAEPDPAATLRIRYEYREQLVQLGLLPQPHDPDPWTRRERARGFTDSDFAPDPYRARR